MDASAADAAWRAPSRVLFDSSLVQVGEFRCPTAHPRFADSGPSPEYCFVFPRTAVWIQHEGGVPFVADSTVVPLYNGGQPYRRRPISRDGDRTDWFGVAPELLRDALVTRGSPDAAAARQLFSQSFARASAGLFVMQRRVFDRVRTARHVDRLFVEEAVLTLLDAVLDDLDRAAGRTPGPAERRRAASEDARAHLNRSYAAGEDLGALARRVGTSMFHLCRIFKRHTGQTLHGYRGQLRLRRSLELLGESADILSIALALGYSGHSHFTAAFRGAFGMTPSAYRGLSRGGRAAVADAFRREQSAVSSRGRL
jgi:AraC-like DNA-binding protein